jgi:hypothetical protein
MASAPFEFPAMPQLRAKRSIRSNRLPDLPIEALAKLPCQAEFFIALDEKQ